MRFRSGGIAVLLVLGLSFWGRPATAVDTTPNSAAAPGLSLASPRFAPWPPAAPAAPAPWVPRTLTLLASGDVLLHSGLWRDAANAAGHRGYDFAPLLSDVAPVVRNADLAICHLETPVGRPGGPFSGYPIFTVPPQIAPALRTTGYDSCSTASNHSLDGGAAGVKRTLDALDRAGIAHTGTARSAAEAARPTIYDVDGVRVGHVSYTFSFNGLSEPRDKPWIANELGVAALRREARRARAAGAEFVIASIHWGTEYAHQPDALQRRVAREVLSSPDVDLILGHHAHVVQPFERIGSKWVAYGLGNHVSSQDFSADTQDGVMARFTLTEVAPGKFQISRAEALPTWMLLGGGRPARVLDAARCAGSARNSAALRRTCLASWRRTAGHVSGRGARAAGLVVVR
ncbi:poly-gamma-glutamate biosynthesis protein [Asanoa ishikariensis]|uniref:Poly-gamma-glutamate synthesis protein (Capsule biosynthesis protein) n=1 Tax=Asanoa ishikariensis TaxID=137265 RepID=A0A1H3L6J4_9ACTN|nr:CapA family protein [Asanoa ishikariensis]GIF69491.1 poly-gamma-glutamate biosynthesis protein [Asanoa ishikariensis]SDY59554.1 poly-gamma-glutamate synthesis protein (capsule biosynthesis protein) [Asanoa ishikariensis]